MTISELIKQLEDLKKEHGDIDVKVQTLTHAWAPEPTPRPGPPKAARYILLNP